MSKAYISKKTDLSSIGGVTSKDWKISFMIESNLFIHESDQILIEQFDWIIFLFIQIGSLSLHVMILFGTKLLNMFKIIWLKMETCIPIFLPQKNFSQFSKSRAFRMLDKSTFL